MILFHNFISLHNAINWDYVYYIQISYHRLVLLTAAAPPFQEQHTNRKPPGNPRGSNHADQPPILPSAVTMKPSMLFPEIS